MLNKLPAFIREYGLIAPGERVICAVSGGADSVARSLTGTNNSSGNSAISMTFPFM